MSSQTPVPQLLGDLIEKGIARKFYLSIIIERHIRVEALLDKGADITLMSTELLKEVQERTKRTNRTLKLQRCELNVQAYSHTGLQLKHVAPIHLTVGPMDFVHPVYVSTLNTYPLLIGKDFLNRFELQAPKDLDTSPRASALPVIRLQRVTVSSHRHYP